VAHLTTQRYRTFLTFRYAAYLPANLSGDVNFGLIDRLATTYIDFGSWPSYIGFDMSALKSIGFDQADVTAHTASLVASYEEMRRGAEQRADLMGAGVREVFAGLDVEPRWCASLPHHLQHRKQGSRTDFAHPSEHQRASSFNQRRLLLTRYEDFTSDYDPPSIFPPGWLDREDDNAKFGEELDALFTDLSSAADRARRERDAAKARDANASTMALQYLTAQRSSIELEFASLSGDPDFTNIFAGIADLSALILIFDYVYAQHTHSISQHHASITLHHGSSKHKKWSQHHAR
jgi:hypothetical protein